MSEIRAIVIDSTILETDGKRSGAGDSLMNPLDESNFQHMPNGIHQ